MATKQYTYQTRYLAATPRNKRLTEGIQSAAQSGGGGIGYIPSSGPQYWQLVTVDAEGNALPEEQYYLMPVSGKHLHMPGDVVAYAVEPTDANQHPSPRTITLRVCSAPRREADCCMTIRRMPGTLTRIFKAVAV